MFDLKKISGAYGEKKIHTIGIEVEMSWLQYTLQENNFPNKTILATSVKKIGDYPFFKFVVEGRNGSQKPYIEIVSAPMREWSDILNFFNVIHICHDISKTKLKTLSEFFVAFNLKSNINIDIENLSDDVKDAKCVFLNGKRTPNSVHVNVSVPFKKIYKLLENEHVSRIDYLQKAFDMANKKLGNFCQGDVSLKTFVALFYYQKLALNFVSAVSIQTAKEKCDMLVKVSRNDIINSILSDKEKNSLNDAATLRLIKSGLEELKRQRGSIGSAVSGQEIAPVLIDSTQREEVRDSGNLPVIKDDDMDTAYVVVEFRGKTSEGIGDCLKKALGNYCVNKKTECFYGFLEILNKIYMLTK